MKDIESKKEIKILVDHFYEKIRADESLGPIFNDIAHVDWDKHLPLLYDFWEGILFNATKYQGNPIEVHRKLSHKTPLKKELFDQWLKLFNQTVDEHFKGEKAEQAKTRALSIATVMQIKLQND